MSKRLPLPHLSLSLHPLLAHPLLLLAPVFVILMIITAAWRVGRALLAVGILGTVVYSLYSLYKTVNAHMGKGHSSWLVMPTLDSTNHEKALPVLPVQGPNYGFVAVLAVAGVVIGLSWLAMRSSGYSLPYVLNRMWVWFVKPISRGGKAEAYSFPDVVIGTVIGEAEPGLPDAGKGAGKRVVIGAKDRFLNMGIIGPIGSGKTFMTMKPMIYQDLEAVSKGTLANVVWMSPQPEPGIEGYAESLGLTVRRIHIIDGQVGPDKITNVRFNPLAGNDIDAIINNVNVVLNEQTGDKGKGDAFFDIMAAQATTDSLQLYKFLHGFDEEGNPIEIDMIGWYDRYLVKMDELFYEAERVQAVSDRDRSNKAAVVIDERAEWIGAVIWPKLNDAQRIMLRRAAASIINEFGGSLEGKNAEAYKNIIRGLRGKVRVLISSKYVQELLGTEVSASADRPNFEFESWIDPGEWTRPNVEDMKAWKEQASQAHKGELLTVITGQTETGKLVGRMILVFLQQAVLNRPGKDNDKPPVYTYVDEYPSYATRSINEIRTQGRKHCHSMVMAMQSRAQMEQVGKGYLETMEGSARHWVYLSNLGSEDALQVSRLCGQISRIQKSTATRQIRMAGLGLDNGQPLVTKTEKEELVDRFSPQFIRYELTENEVIYVGVKERKGQTPIRMRINEPQENKALVKKNASAPDVTKKRKTPKRSKPVSVYPDRERVATVKWPLFTIGHTTMYVYLWGLSLGRDVYGPRRKVASDMWRTVDVNPPELGSSDPVEPTDVSSNIENDESPVQETVVQRTDTVVAEEREDKVREKLAFQPQKKPVLTEEPEVVRKPLRFADNNKLNEPEGDTGQDAEQVTRTPLRFAKSEPVKKDAAQLAKRCPRDGTTMFMKLSKGQRIWTCNKCGQKIVE